MNYFVWLHLESKIIISLGTDWNQPVPIGTYGAQQSTGIGMCVDVWHFKNKHKVTHEYCQKHCNLIQYPELLDEKGKWYFNTSVAKQVNAWLGGYLSIC